MIEHDKIIVVINIVSTEKTNTIATNVRSTVSINFHSERIRDCIIYAIYCTQFY